MALEPIADEMGRNASILKTLEGVLYERQTGLSLLNTSLIKARNVLETIEYRECSLKTAVDAYFAVADQVCFYLVCIMIRNYIIIHLFSTGMSTI